LTGPTGADMRPAVPAPGAVLLRPAAVFATICLVRPDGAFTVDGNRDLDFLGKAIGVRSASGDPGSQEALDEVHECL
jgi:hypothetical protein